MPTLDIADAGRIFLGLNRNASYDAARAGVIPTIEVGGHRMKAVTKALAEKVGVTVNF